MISTLRVVLALAAVAWALVGAYVGYVRTYYGVMDWWNVDFFLVIPGTGLAAMFALIFGRAWGAIVVGIQAAAFLLFIVVYREGPEPIVIALVGTMILAMLGAWQIHRGSVASAS